ncbi:MAG: cytochrome c maturation protein CcmE [Gammaproteobacteria bacterium]|nr:cytochrome c maturation protein CcmE [Gammaproteobacteria bacterium]PCH64685.1 MAG: cytochrome c maturation protein CcmE [Gammaproteobacteria bacterium]
MKPRQKRMTIILGGLAGLGIVIALVLNAFQGNLVFFFSPSQIAANEAPEGRSFRLGGLVEEGSLRREDDGLTVHFYVTDTAQRVPVTYTGILPDLFTEGQGVVAQGKLDGSGHFTASEVLAKHDETYMAPEVAEALELAKGEMPASSSLVQ